MQHREWNPKAFFRKVSPAVMALFEARFEMALVRHPGKPTADQTYHAWKALPDAERRAAENRLLLVPATHPQRITRFRKNSYPNI